MLGADPGLPGGRHVEAPGVGGEVHRRGRSSDAQTSSPAYQPAWIGVSSGSQRSARVMNATPRGAAQPLVGVADGRVEQRGVDGQHAGRLGEVAEGERAVRAAAATIGGDVGDRAGGGLHEREGDEPGVVGDRVGERLERDAAAPRTPRPWPANGNDDRAEVARRRRAPRRRRARRRRSRETMRRRLRADGHAVDVDAHEPGEWPRGCARRRRRRRRRARRRPPSASRSARMRRRPSTASAGRTVQAREVAGRRRTGARASVECGHASSVEPRMSHQTTASLSIAWHNRSLCSSHDRSDLDLASTLRVIRAVADTGTHHGGRGAPRLQPARASASSCAAPKRSSASPLVLRSGAASTLTEAGRRARAPRRPRAGRPRRRPAGARRARAALRSGRVRLAGFPSASSTIVPASCRASATGIRASRVSYIEAEPPEAVGAPARRRGRHRAHLHATRATPDAGRRPRRLAHRPSRRATRRCSCCRRAGRPVRPGRSSSAPSPEPAGSPAARGAAGTSSRPAPRRVRARHRARDRQRPGRARPRRGGPRRRAAAVAVARARRPCPTACGSSACSTATRPRRARRPRSGRRRVPSVRAVPRGDRGRVDPRALGLRARCVERPAVG